MSILTLRMECMGIKIYNYLGVQAILKLSISQCHRVSILCDRFPEQGTILFPDNHIKLNPPFCSLRVFVYVLLRMKVYHKGTPVTRLNFQKCQMKVSLSKIVFLTIFCKTSYILFGLCYNATCYIICACRLSKILIQQYLSLGT